MGVFTVEGSMALSAKLFGLSQSSLTTAAMYLQEVLDDLGSSEIAALGEHNYQQLRAAQLHVHNAIHQHEPDHVKLLDNGFAEGSN